ncbi:FUSC family protein [Pseudonocardia sp. GCM10023141]|uniref:FUSC family protein n=1 Tax=Pseudonocardia sp. GCM10023141 TaxID=3252653 RepID=UPI003609E66B
MHWRSRLTELRTTLTGVDPGLVRLRFGGIAALSMALAVVIMSVIRALTGEPITVVLIAGVLAMASNLAVNEPELGRLRVTTALMLLPALGAVAGGTLLAPHRIVADAVFVVVMVVAAYIRRWGPRGNALGMAAFFGYFFTQFLQAAVAQLPSLLVATVIGIGSTLLLRGFLFTEHSERTLARLSRAFRAHVHALVEAVAGLLQLPPDATAADIERELVDVRSARTKLNETALLVVDRLERDDHPGAEHDEALELRVLDAELAAERLSVATRRLVQGEPFPDDVRRTLAAGLQSLGAATATGTEPSVVSALLDSSRRSVASIVAETDGLGDRAQRVAFAIVRLSNALESSAAAAAPAIAGHRGVAAHDDPHPDRPADRPADLHADLPDEPEPRRDPVAATTTTPGLLPTTRVAVQVGVATSLAIVLGELISPARWYWAVIAAFVVFAGTTSRGDVLSRGTQRVIGTIGGVAAGMGLALLVGDAAVPALILMFGCVFFALYLVRVSQALMAFWVTAVLALLYGLIGQFSVETLLLRIAETAAGAALGMLAGYLVLPTGTREAFGDALDTLVDSADSTLDAAVDRLVGREPETAPVELARAMDDALGVLRLRAKPLDNPLPRRRGRGSYQRALRVLTGVDHYIRRIARISDSGAAPGWATTLEPAVERVRSNLDALRQLLRHRDPGPFRSAEEVVDAAEAFAARTEELPRRAQLLTVARMLRRIDQAVVGFAADIGGKVPDDQQRPA